MPQIIPIKDLKNTAEISQLCRSSEEPIFITKNGYGDMVIMSIDTYEKRFFMQETYHKIAEAEIEVDCGNVLDAMDGTADLKEKIWFIGYRRLTIKNYIALYSVDETSGIIYILRFFYGRRDWLELL